MKIAVVIPTLNEAKNIIALIGELLKLNLNIDILVVDDNSPDGTAEIVKKSFKKNGNIFVLLRQNKRGRGSACIDGFKYFLSNGKRYDCIFEMDADFSHDPKEISLFLEKISGYDMIIGSRYLKKSRIINWSLKRRIFSKLANFYARLLLQIPITDYTNGYRCYRYNVLKNIDFNFVKENGYVVLAEIAYQMFLKAYSIGEVPTLFVNRKRGISNLNFREIWHAFKRITVLRFRVNTL
ncbi:polyprenol monophosphomannose synthase [bacterium]|nr:polyprenol monophosphomannose synthase [bacterium]